MTCFRSSLGYAPVGVLLFFVTALAGALGLSNEARATDVDLELVLAVDVSGSVEPDEADLQRQGFVDAFRSDAVQRVITSGRLGRVAVTLVEWAGADIQYTVVGWTLIDGPESAYAFADELAAAPVTTAMWTSISRAMDFSAALFEINGYNGTRKVIDISGDGANNQGDLVTVARDRLVRAGITINGLPIVNGRPSPYGMPQTPNLDLYFQDCVIGGPGAFIVVANGFEDFARAIRRKLIIEIAGLDAYDFEPRRMKAQMPTRPPCDAGEEAIKNMVDDY